MIELLKHSSLRILVAAAVPCLWLPAGAVAAQASPVTLSRAPSVSENDYPARAIRAEVQGSVVVVIAVDPTGAATGCTPIEIESPGFGLEDATCRVWTQRATFSPARNASGVAIPGTYRAELNWALAEPEPAPPAPVIAPANPVARDPFRVQTVRCDTGSGFYIWRVDWDNDLITEVVSGLTLDIQDIESTSSSSGFIEALTGWDSLEHIIDLDLFYEESSDENGDLVEITFTRQSVESTRGSGPSMRFNRYSGACRPFRG